MTDGVGQRWTLAAYPQGLPRESDFRLERFDLPRPKSGQALVRMRYHTVAPGVRAKLAGDTYAAQIRIGEPIVGYGVGTVELSEASGLAPGDHVVGELPWGTHALVDASAVQRIDPDIFESGAVPLAASIGVLGAPGLTAYFGLMRIGQAKTDETVLISSAAGAVGSIVGQIARIQGCHVIGIAGSSEKCAELEDVFGFDEALDYRSTPNLAESIAKTTASGVDLYFDNVGGDVTEAAIANMKLFGRVVVCGQTSDYNRAEPRGFRSMTQVITRRLMMRGFVVHDFTAEFGAVRKQLAQWLREGLLVHRANEIEGIDAAAAAFVGQFSGRGTNRPLIKVD